MFHGYLICILTLLSLKSVAGVCEDNPNHRIPIGDGDVRTSCKWIVANPNKTQLRRQAFCSEKNTNSVVRAACPKSCDICPADEVSHQQTLSSSASQAASVTRSLSCADDTAYQFQLDNGKMQKCEWISKNKKKKSSRQQKYCNQTQFGRLISEACTAACEASCTDGPPPPTPTSAPTKAPTNERDFDPKSSTITNDKVWYDDDGNVIHANRCGSISHEKYDRYWYMVGSKSSKVWVSYGWLSYECH
jgi:hypothetical protein